MKKSYILFVVFFVFLAPIVAYAETTNTLITGVGVDATATSIGNQVKVQSGQLNSQLSLTQIGNPADIAANHTGVSIPIYQMGTVNYFGPHSAPSNTLTSLERFFQAFPLVIRKGAVKDRTIEAEGKSGKTIITFTFHPSSIKKKVEATSAVKKTGESSWFIPSSDSAPAKGTIEVVRPVTLLLSAKYRPVGFLSVEAVKVGVQPEILMDDAVEFLLTDKRLAYLDTSDEVIAYMDPFGSSASSGNEGKTKSLAIGGGGGNVTRSGDLVLGGGIGGGSGFTHGVAVIGKKFWIMKIDPEKGEKFELLTYIGMPVSSVKIENQSQTSDSDLPKKAKAAGVNGQQ